MAARRPFGPIGPPLAWRGSELDREVGAWRRALDNATLDALGAAADRISHDPGAWPTLDPASLRVPQLEGLAQSVLETLLAGRGFIVLTGLPVDRWPHPRIAAAYWILGNHVGRPVPQNAQGHLLGHVIDLGRDASDPSVRIYQTSERQQFHTDSADVVALLCLRTARRGGRSSLASIAMAHDLLQRRHPELLPHLFEPIATDQRGEPRAGQAPYFTIPVFSWHEGRLVGCYQRRYIESAARFPGAPRPSPAQIAALDALDAILEEVRLDMELRPGDVQLIHNHGLFHDRTAFTDWPDPARRRHLLRLWLCPPTGWELPGRFAQRYGSITPGKRGGVQPRGGVSTPLLPD